MKGARAKKAAEEAAKAAEAAGGGLEPTPPTSGAPTGRPGPVVQASGNVALPASEFRDIIAKIRSNELLGAAAADALEAAAGSRSSPAPQGKSAKDLRGEVADSREASPEKPKKKGGMKFDDAPAEEVPDLKEEEPRRPSVIEADVAGHELEEMANHCEKDAEEPPELNLSPKQNKMRTDLEMWVMDEIPTLFGVDDSEELDEKLQEDGQADSITFLIAETEEEKQTDLVNKWLGDGEQDGREDFVNTLLEKVRAIQALGPKKKKKKKKTKTDDES